VERTQALFAGWDWDHYHGAPGLFFSDGSGVLVHAGTHTLCPWAVVRGPGRPQPFDRATLDACLAALATPGALFPWTGFSGQAAPALQEAAATVGADLALLALDKARALGFSGLEGSWSLDGACVGRHGELVQPALEVGLLWGNKGDVDAILRWLGALHSWTHEAVDPTLPTDLASICQNLAYNAQNGGMRGDGRIGPQPFFHSEDNPTSFNAHQTLAARHRLAARFGPLPV
jgi:hypothetical protein